MSPGVLRKGKTMKQSYLSWLAKETASRWNNDSAIMAQVESAEAIGAIGATTNPPLSFETLTTETGVYGDALAKIDKKLPDNEYALQAMSLVPARLAKHFAPLHEKRGTYYGCVRAQVGPPLRYDAEGMLASGKKLAALGKNIMVKIPGTKAGMWVLEELAALGIPTNPTVITTVAQAVESAEAYERGRKRAEKAGIKPGWSTCAVVMGRAQDYFAALNKERNLGLATEDLEWAALAIVKRSYQIYNKNKYNSLIMPAAFRAPIQLEQLSGGEFHSTIHPKVQAAVAQADEAGKMRRELLIDAPLNQAALDRVASKMPEFIQSYEPDALKPADFDHFGSVVMTLDGFDVTGWQKLVGLKKA